MNLELRQAPHAHRPLFKQLSEIPAATLDVVDMGTFARFTYSGFAFDPNYVSYESLIIGKEYGTVEEPHQLTKEQMLASSAVECPTQKISCIPSPSGYPPADVWDKYRCYTGIWDSTIMYKTGELAPSGVVDVPYNVFGMTANKCAIQTDGKAAQYYFEFNAIHKSTYQSQRIKVLFDWTSPSTPAFDQCGEAASVPTEPATPATPTEPEKGKGQGNKPIK